VRRGKHGAPALNIRLFREPIGICCVKRVSNIDLMETEGKELSNQIINAHRS